MECEVGVVEKTDFYQQNDSKILTRVVRSDFISERSLWSQYWKVDWRRKKTEAQKPVENLEK